MLIPARRLEIAKTYHGRSSAAGWLAISLQGLDLEGVTKLYVNLDEVTTLEQKRDEAKARLVELFGEDEDEAV